MPAKKPVVKKKISFEAQAILRECTENQLAFLSDVSSSKNFDAGLELIRNMIEREMAAVFAYSEADPPKLAVYKAHARGGVGKLTVFMHLTKGAEAEKDRREKVKKRG